MSFDKFIFRDLKSFLVANFWAGETCCSYKAIICFVVFGLKNNVPYVIKASPENEINGEWLKNQLMDCVKTWPT